LVRFPEETKKKVFQSPKSPVGHIRWVPVTLPRGMRWLAREADHSPPSNAEVTNEYSCTFTPPYAFMACARKTDILPFLDLVMTMNILRNSESHLVCVTHTGQLQTVLPCALKDEASI
jgi:hypothetical protein